MTDNTDQKGEGGFRRRDLMAAAALGTLGVAGAASASVSEQGPSDFDVKLEGYKALFWAEFGRAANMPFDYVGCAQVAVRRGWFDKIASHIKDGTFEDKTNGLLETTKNCCRKAGRIAAGRAAGGTHPASEIDASMFESAADIVKDQTVAAAKRMGIDSSVVGGICF